MKKLFSRLKAVLPSKRKLIQLYSALLFNANIKGFFNGRIYKGPLKNICTPGLNCYSCPGASGACPLGALQNSLAETNKRAPYYMFGIIILYGILLGRWICGWLCPFGLIQELLYKIKTPKLKKSKITRALSYLKYVILVFFVFVVPIMYAFRDFPLPAFCKYICPAGTLEGAIGLLSNAVNESELARLGPLFTWKFTLMVSFVVGSVFIFRLFCRFVCPLGALYGLFNKISVLGIKLEKPKCIDCGLCVSKCKMDIRHVGDHECISCGDCIEVCPTKAITWKGKSIVLPENEIAPITEEMTEEERAIAEESNLAHTVRMDKRKRTLKIITASVMAVVLAAALIYYNFINKNVELPVGADIGDLCIGQQIPLFDETGELDKTFDPSKNHGKITVINFWGTWCGPCKAELPDFDRIASEYEDEVTIIAIHTVNSYSSASKYVEENFKDSLMIFGKDSLLDPDDPYGGDYYFSVLGGTDSYPMTVILDEDGVIIESITDTLHYDELKEIIENALKN